MKGKSRRVETRLKDERWRLVPFTRAHSERVKVTTKKQRLQAKREGKTLE